MRGVELKEAIWVLTVVAVVGVDWCGGSGGNGSVVLSFSSSKRRRRRRSDNVSCVLWNP